MSKYSLPTCYQQFIHLSRYARWIDNESRRERWDETVDRYLGYMCDEQCHGKIDAKTREELRKAMMSLEVMPSMRCMMTAGPALKRDNIAGFNCTGIVIDDIAAFDEVMYCLMCLAPETTVRTSTGSRALSDITCEDKVLSLNESGEYEYVSPSFVGETPSAHKKKIELEFEDGCIVCVTEDHRFLTNRGWIEARHLAENDEIVNYHEVS